jgi:hypothetical protein
LTYLPDAAMPASRSSIINQFPSLGLLQIGPRHAKRALCLADVGFGDVGSGLGVRSGLLGHHAALHKLLAPGIDVGLLFEDDLGPLDGRDEQHGNRCNWR